MSKSLKLKKKKIEIIIENQYDYRLGLRSVGFVTSFETTKG